MSWDESEPEPRSCPCENGQYAVIYRSDDWGRSDERWEMQCADCKERYRLYTYYTNRHAIPETRHGWVETSLLSDLEHLEEQLEQRKRELQQYAVHSYRECWASHFTGKPKNRVWSELTQDGQRYAQLSTFYAHIRQSGLTSALDGYLCYPEVYDVIRILGLKDSELQSKLNTIETLRKDADQQETEIRRHCIA